MDHKDEDDDPKSKTKKQRTKIEHREILIGGQVHVKKVRVPLTEEELEEEAPHLPAYLIPVWRDFIKLGSEFSYEGELVPYLDRHCADDLDDWVWRETLLLTLRAEVSKWNSERMKEKKGSVGDSGKSKPKEKSPGLGKGKRGETKRFDGIEGVRQYQEQFGTKGS